MIGLKGRCGLLQSLGSALESHPEFFGAELSRPGNLVDYVQKHATNGRVSIRVLWKPIVDGLESVSIFLAN